MVINCDWLKTEIALFIDPAECIEKLNETPDFIKEHTNALAGSSNGADGASPPLFFIYIGVIDDSATFAGVIVHEVVHLVDFLLDYKGIETRCVNTETKAYMCEWLFNEVMNLIEEVGAK